MTPTSEWEKFKVTAMCTECETESSFTFDLSEDITNVRAEARQEENQAWIDGKRCHFCGREMEPHPFTETCEQCWQNK